MTTRGPDEMSKLSAKFDDPVPKASEAIAALDVASKERCTDVHVQPATLTVRKEWTTRCGMNVSLAVVSKTSGGKSLAIAARECGSSSLTSVRAEGITLNSNTLDNLTALLQNSKLLETFAVNDIAEVDGVDAIEQLLSTIGRLCPAVREVRLLHRRCSDRARAAWGRAAREWGELLSSASELQKFVGGMVDANANTVRNLYLVLHRREAAPLESFEPQECQEFGNVDARTRAALLNCLAQRTGTPQATLEHLVMTQEYREEAAGPLCACFADKFELMQRCTHVAHEIFENTCITEQQRHEIPAQMVHIEISNAAGDSKFLTLRPTQTCAPDGSIGPTGMAFADAPGTVSALAEWVDVTIDYESEKAAAALANNLCQNAIGSEQNFEPVTVLPGTPATFAPEDMGSLEMALESAIRMFSKMPVDTSLDFGAAWAVEPEESAKQPYETVTTTDVVFVDGTIVLPLASLQAECGVTGVAAGAVSGPTTPSEHVPSQQDCEEGTAAGAVPEPTSPEADVAADDITDYSAEEQTSPLSLHCMEPVSVEDFLFVNTQHSVPSDQMQGVICESANSVAVALPQTTSVAAGIIVDDATFEYERAAKRIRL